MTARVAYTEEQQGEFKVTFAKRKRRNIAIWVGAAVAFALSFFLPEAVAFPVGKGGPPGGVLILPLAIIASLINWRCPACGRLLNNEWSPNFCSKCGIEFQ
jgi:hypothetical protein